MVQVLLELDGELLPNDQLGANGASANAAARAELAVARRRACATPQGEHELVPAAQQQNTRLRDVKVAALHGRPHANVRRGGDLRTKQPSGRQQATRNGSARWNGAVAARGCQPLAIRPRRDTDPTHRERGDEQELGSACLP